MKTPAVALGLMLFVSASSVVADIPVRDEQLVYSILAFNGKEYVGTFAREDSDTIYLVAGADNILSASKTFVYFWPISEEWKIENSVLNIPLPGQIELTDRIGRTVVLEATPYTYFNEWGEYEMNWKLVTGAQAIDVFRRHQELVDDYWRAVDQFNDDKAFFEAFLAEIGEKVTKMEEAGEDTTSIIESLKDMEAPKQPPYPDVFASPPIPIQMAFVFNLDVGEYGIRFLTSDGEVMEGSERRIVAFEERRDNGIGLEVIPGDKWTRPTDSRTPASVLYVDGSTDLYLRPFHQREYNDLYYEKLLKNDARGNPSQMKWVRIQQVPGATVEVISPSSRPVVLEEKPFVVEQVQGASLGYEILPYDPDGRHLGRSPSIMAYHIPLSRNPKVVHLKVRDKDGRYLPTGSRQVRIVSPTGRGIGLLILVPFPLMAMIVVMIRRSRKYDR